MLTILGKQTTRFCDGISRRGFLKIGALGLGGLSLADLLRSEAQSGTGRSHKSVIMVFLAGGPSHLDMFDLKPDAPVEIRGEFRPIRTNVPGMEICEHLPRLASLGNKLAIIRSLSGCVDRHEPHMCFSGYPANDRSVSGGRPCLGSVLSYLRGPVDKSVPAFVGLAPKTGHVPWGNSGEPGFLGLAHGPFKPDGEGMANMKLDAITPDRLADRKGLLRAFDRFRRDYDADGSVAGVDAFTEQAFDVLTSSKVLEALDIEREPPRGRERYGRGSLDAVVDGPPMYNEYFLLARRLVEAGVRCVTFSFGRWDTHGDPNFDGKTNFASLRDFLPRLDQALSALIEDLQDRGLDEDVSLVVWGEFGRTPRINKNGGRDHWPQANFALLAGGGMRTGQVIGSTNRLGEVPKDRPVRVQSVLATLYHKLGIDLETTIIDPAGRPQYLLDVHEPIHELV